MKASMKNYLLIGGFFLFGLMSASLLTSCSDDDDNELVKDPDPVALSTPVKSGEPVATATTITFSWQSVENAGSYSYVLKNASGTQLESNTTTNTSVYFSGLQAVSSYSLEVTAIPTNTEAYLNSATLTITATTLDYNQLATPVQDADPVATLTSLTFSWAAVDGAADYAYTLKDAADAELASGTTDKTNLYFSPLSNGTTYTLEVIAEPSASDTEAKASNALTITATTLDYIQLATPEQAAEVEPTNSSLKFSWTAVEHAANYTYVLKDEQGNEKLNSATEETALYISNLEQKTTYTLEVTAQPAADEEIYLASEVLTLTGATGPYTLATPKVTATAGARSVFTWDAVDNAEAYEVSYENVLDTVTTTTYNLDFLTLNQAVTVSVVAINSNELYENSESSSATVTRTRKEVERVEGINVYKPAESTRTIISYSDGSYVIPAWYGVEGYDLEFLLNESGNMVVNAYCERQWYWLATGVDDNGCWFYVDDGYGALEGDLTYGDIWFWDSAANGYYYYAWHHYNGTWTKPDGNIVETYAQDNYDGSYTIKNWYGIEGYDFNFTLGDDNEIVPADEYYCSGNYYWVQYGAGDNDGSWIYTTGGYSKWDETGIWFWDSASNSYYWLKFDTEEE
jgi:ribosomal protein L14